ncbi:4197_t:CDS:2, partial [Funneliformis caledonium]
SKDHSIEGWIVSENDSKWAPLKLDPDVTVYKLLNDENLNEIKSFRSLYFKNDGNLVLIKNGFRILVITYLRVYFGLDRILVSREFYKVFSDKAFKEIIIRENKLWAISLNYLFQWNLDTFKFEFDYSLESNGIDVMDVIMKGKVSIKVLSKNYLLAFNLPKKGKKQDISLYHTTENNKQPVEGSKIFNDDNLENVFTLFEYSSRRAF